MSDQPVDAIRAAILARGRIPFSEFMELALYGPGGFYEEPPVGEGGHFVTSPHVHPVFGTFLARAIEQAWRHLGSPARFHVVELGAGDGTLASQLLGELAGVPVEYVAVERSPGARRRLQELPIQVEASLEMLPEGLTGLVFANELLDNLPFERVRRTKAGLVRVAIDVRGDRFVEVEVPLVSDLEELVPAEFEGETPVSEAALSLIDRVARVLRRGYALFIDYGSATGSEAHGYRAHRVLRDLLADPGSADITAGVAFDPLVARATEWGLEALGPISQSQALKMLGIEEWLESERVKQVDHLDRREGRGAVTAYDSRQRAMQLIDPNGLGALQWLWLATPGAGWWTALLDPTLEDLF